MQQTISYAIRIIFKYLKFHQWENHTNDPNNVNVVGSLFTRFEFLDTNVKSI